MKKTCKRVCIQTIICLLMVLAMLASPLQAQAAENHPKATQKGIVLYDTPKTMYCKSLDYKPYQTDTFSDASLKKSYSTNYSLGDGQRVTVLGFVKGTNLYYIKYNHYDCELCYWYSNTAFCRKSILEKKRSQESIDMLNYDIERGMYPYNFPKDLDTQIEINNCMRFDQYNFKINENTYKIANIEAPVSATVKILETDEENSTAKLRIKVNGIIEQLSATQWENWVNLGRGAHIVDTKYFKINKKQKKQTVDITIKGSGTWFLHLDHKVNKDGSISSSDILTLGIRI